MATTQAADPLSSIANAVGSIFKSVSNVILADKQENIEYQRWLAETFPEYKWYFKYEKQRENSWIWIGILSLLIIVVVIATAVVKRKQK